jgi:hypothetical protein
MKLLDIVFDKNVLYACEIENQDSIGSHYPGLKKQPG